MTEPIPVKDALKLIEMALADCDKATPGRYADAPALSLARATMRPMLENIEKNLWHRVEVYDGDLDGGVLYPPLAALRDHYDAVRPDWRTE